MQSYNRAYNTFTELWLHNRKTRTVSNDYPNVDLYVVETYQSE